MKLSEFLITHMQEILAEWDAYARRMTPAADDMTRRELRDHARQMLKRIADHLESSSPVPDEATAGREGGGGPGVGSGQDPTAAQKHGTLRHQHQFTLLQLSSEFRSLRTVVLRMWLPHVDHIQECIDAVVRFNEALDEALAESIGTFAAATKAKHDLFVAILGHDLRGPLATMSMVGGMMGEPGMREQRLHELGDAINASVGHMTSMVNDLLDVAQSKLNDGLPIACRSADALRVCRAALADVRAMYPTREFVLSDASPVPGELDPDRLQQLVTNLLVNAAQHGASDEPVRVEVRADTTTITLCVSNRGTPIPEKELKRIFDPAYSLGDVARRPAPVGGNRNLGLGLYIAREVALGHRGRIDATSNERDGTAFVVTLPRTPRDSLTDS